MTPSMKISTRITGLPKLESAHDILHRLPHPLDVFFSPESVAVIGATEKPGSVGRTLLWNLITNPFGGAVFPVNPKRPSVLGIKAYPNIGAVPEKVELAVIVTPARVFRASSGNAAMRGERARLSSRPGSRSWARRARS